MFKDPDQLTKLTTFQDALSSCSFSLLRNILMRYNVSKFLEKHIDLIYYYRSTFPNITNKFNHIPFSVFPKNTKNFVIKLHVKFKMSFHQIFKIRSQ